MRGATQCAQRLKRLIAALRTQLGKLPPPAVEDPITQMLLGVLSRDVPESKARAALELLRSMVVDYNELRVIPPIELADLLGDYPEARLKCEDMSRALNKIFAEQHDVTLEFLREKGGKDARAYLDDVDGLDAYSRARVRLLGLGQHAFPLDEAMWAYGRSEEILDPRCSLDEAQGFLERQIGKDEALEVLALISHQAWATHAEAVRNRQVERILSVPPDRTARNMLQLISSGLPPSAGEAVAEDDGDLPADDAGDDGGGDAPPDTPAKSSKRARRSGGPAQKTAERAANARAKSAAKGESGTRRKKTSKKSSEAKASAPARSSRAKSRTAGRGAAKSGETKRKTKSKSA